MEEDLLNPDPNVSVDQEGRLVIDGEMESEVMLSHYVMPHELPDCYRDDQDVEFYPPTEPQYTGAPAWPEYSVSSYLTKPID